MPFYTPPLSELVQRARMAFRAELPGTDAWLWPNNVNVSAKVMAGMTHLNMLWLAYIAKQRWVSTADGEFLDKHGFVYGMPRTPASLARGYVVMYGNPGLTVPAGIGIARGDGIGYTVTTGGEVSGLGSVQLFVTANETGPNGNALAGTAVSFTQARDGMTGDGQVDVQGIGQGADEEDDESYRARLLWRLRMPPMGGSAHDYVAWARMMPGVTRVYVDPLADGPGTVTVYFLMDDTYTNGIPQAADIDAVNEFIQSVRPATAVVTVLAPVPVSVDITVDQLSPDTQDVRDAVILELQDLFAREVRVSTVSEPFTLYRSKIWQAVANASGEDHHVLVAPATDVTYAKGQLPVFGTVTFT